LIPSQEERLWRRLSFRLMHELNRCAWARTDKEGGAWAARARRTREAIFDLDSERKRREWNQLYRNAALSYAERNERHPDVA
jgi:hypothetical protein